MWKRHVLQFLALIVGVGMLLVSCSRDSNLLGPKSRSASTSSVLSNPTEPGSLTSEDLSDGVLLKWVAPVRKPGYDYAYRVYRSNSSTAEFENPNGKFNVQSEKRLEQVGLQPVEGGVTEDTSFVDITAEVGTTYYYRVRIIQYVRGGNDLQGFSKDFLKNITNMKNHWTNETSGSRLAMAIYDLQHEPIRFFAQGDKFFYTTSDQGVYSYDLQSQSVTHLYPFGATSLMWVEEGYGYTGAEHRDQNRVFAKFDINTGETIWRVSNADWSFGAGFGSDGIYVANGWDNVKKLDKTNGSTVWVSGDIGRYVDDVVVDRFRGYVLVTAYWSPTEITRLNPDTGEKIWSRTGLPETSRVVDITETEIWVLTAGHLESWRLDTGATIAAYTNEPYTKIWHLGPEGSLVQSRPEEAGHALVWRSDGSGLMKVDTTQEPWVELWQSEIDMPPLMTSDSRPWIDGQYFYYKDKNTPTLIHRVTW